MTRRVLLVEIGTPAELPVVTPPAPRPPSSWVPDPRPSPGLPPPTGLAVVSIADAAVLSWTPSVAGGQTIIEAAPNVAGVPGIWREVDRTGADTYTISLPGGPRWVRVRAELNGRTSVATNAVLAEPVPVGDISEFEQELRDLQDLVDTVAAQAAADAAALNARADDLRADIDLTIAEISALTDLADDLGTEITRVETESISRDTATVETIDLLGAKNADGTAFILDGDTLRLSPTETLAQWRNSIQGEFASQSSRIDNEAQARQDGDQALATTLATVQATADNAATKAELTSAQSALAAADQALAEDIRVLGVAIGDAANLIAKPSFPTSGDTGTWTGNSGVSSITTYTGVGEHPVAGRTLRINWNEAASNGTAYEPQWHRVAPGEVLVLSMDSRTLGMDGADFYTLGCWFRREDGSQIGSSRQASNSIGQIGVSAVWQSHAGTVVVPEEAVDVRFCISASGIVGGAVLATNITARRQAAGERVNANLIDIARADIQQNADDIVSTVQRIAAAETEIDGKASASDLAATQLTVTQQGNTLTAHGQTLNGLTATVGDHSASINEQREVSAQLLDGSVSINDPGFERREWGGGTSGTGALPGEVTFSTASLNQRAGGQVALRFGADTANRTIYSPRRMRVAPGQQIRFTINSRSGTATDSGNLVSMGVRRYRADGSTPGTTLVATRTSTGGTWGWANGQVSAIYTVPDEIFELQPFVTGTVTSGFIAVDDLSAELVTTDVATMRARYSLAVTAGGDVAGMQLLAGGGTSAIRFLANSMDVVDPGGASGWSLVGGIATWRKGSHMVVIGPGFGANNEFMYWSGPIQSSLANCRRNNAIRYETVTGESFQRGGIIAGTRVHSGFNPGLAVPSIYTTPALSTGGNPIAVNASISYFRQYTTDNNAGRFTPGSGSNTATLQLWRKIGSGAWTMVSSQTFTGSLQIIGEPTTSDQALWNINGAITFTDTDGGTQNRQYEARLVARTLQGVSVQNPAHNIVPVAEQQSVGIVTEEDP